VIGNDFTLNAMSEKASANAMENFFILAPLAEF
jgi:hypothetical protein